MRSGRFSQCSIFRFPASCTDFRLILYTDPIKSSMCTCWSVSADGFFNSGKRASQFPVFLLGFTRDCGGPPWPKRRRLVPPMLLRSRHQLHLIVLVRWQVRWRRCSGWHLAPRTMEVGHGWRWTSHRNLASPTSHFVNAGNQLSHTE